MNTFYLPVSLALRLLNRTMLTIFLTATLWAAHSQSLNAQPTTLNNNEGRYQVEMIIFNRTANNGDTDDELWRRDIALSYPQHYQQLTNLQIMPKSARKLNNLSNKLQNNRGYRVLFHEAWQQQITERNTPAVIIRGGDKIGGHRELEGSIQLRVSRYLHVKTDLWFTAFSVSTDSGTALAKNAWPTLPVLPEDNRQSSNMPAIANIPAIDNIAIFREKRRMRSEELHYIDHPILGLLIIITPIEKTN